MRASAILILIFALMTTSTAQQTDVLSILWRQNLMPAIDEIAMMDDVWIEDIDSDGMGEVVVVTSGLANTKYTNKVNTVQAFSSNGSRDWIYGINNHILNAKMYDINNDHKQEVLVSTGQELNRIQRGKILTISAEGELLRVLDRGEIGSAAFNYLDIGDIDGDRYYEILGGSKTKAYLMRNYGEVIWIFPKTGTIKLNKSIDFVKFDDMNDDGKDEMLVAADILYFVSESGEIVGSIDVEPDLDIRKKGFKFFAKAKLGPTQYYSAYVITDTNTIYTIVIDTIDGEGTKNERYNLLRDWRLEMNCKPMDWLITNTDSDEYDELIIACSDNRIYAIDNNGLIQWDYPLDGTPTDLHSTDMNGDDEDDLLLVTDTGSIYLLDKSGSYLWKYELGEPLEKVGAGFLDPDTIKEVTVLTSNADVLVLTINETYNLRRRADTLYNLGQQSYIISDWEKAKQQFIDSKSLYLKLQDQRGMLDCDEFLGKIEQQQRKKRREQADILLSKARDFFFQEEYDQSETFTNRAMGVYEEFGNTEGILNCELLLIQIEKQKGLYKTITTVPVATTTTTLPMISEEQSGILIYVIVGILAFMVFGVAARNKKKSKVGTIDESIDELSELWDQEFETDENEKGGK